jgi:hypothetical protein
MYTDFWIRNLKRGGYLKDFDKDRYNIKTDLKNTVGECKLDSSGSG